MTEQRESWDEFWAEVEAEQGGPRTETIRGVTVTVPTSLPLRFVRKMERLQDSSRFEDIASLTADLFGQDAVDAWTEAGMGLMELQTIFAWGVAHASGQPVSFRVG